MAYIELDLKATDSAVNAAISMFTEDYLKQAHYLLFSVFGRNSPSEHFGLSAAVMTLLAIASASSIRHFNPKSGRKSIGDGEAFEDFLASYFPWECIGIEDDQNRSAIDRQKAAAEDLYAAIRNPLIHAGGVVGTAMKIVQVRHVFPGRSDQENGQGIEELCGMPTLRGQTVIELSTTATAVHTKELYWAARKAIERLSTDRAAENDIRAKLVRNNP